MCSSDLVLLAKKMGKTRVIAETGAGQHGVATATAAALMDMECEIFMGKEDTDRQALNVYRMELLGEFPGGIPLRHPLQQCHHPGRTKKTTAEFESGRSVACMQAANYQQAAGPTWSATRRPAGNTDVYTCR